MRDWLPAACLWDARLPAGEGILERMRVDALIAATKTGNDWLPGHQQKLLERWLAAYPVQVRGRLLVGTFRVQPTAADEIERHVEKALGTKYEWRFTGTSAAWRMLRHYRGSRVSIQVDGDVGDLRKALRALPDPSGNLIVLRELGPLARQGTQAGLAHPALVYSELMTSGDDRAVETATLISDKVWRK